MSRGPFFKVGDADLEFLQEHWKDLTRPYNSDQTVIEELFNRIVNLYSQRGRAYHNLSHIRSLAALADSVETSIKDCNCLKFALWFHDAIYKTRRKDNEERSADLASQSLMRLKVPPESIDIVREMILATKHHDGHGASEDVRIFLDLDLSILGSEESLYDKYSKAIRREYWWVPDSIYRQGRREVLESFLNRESIYYTEEIAVRYEQQARRNIERELESLLSGARK